MKPTACGVPPFTPTNAFAPLRPNVNTEGFVNVCGVVPFVTVMLATVVLVSAKLTFVKSTKPSMSTFTVPETCVKGAQALTSIVVNGALLNKVRLPFSIFPVSNVAANFFQFFVGTLPCCASSRRSNRGIP